MRMAWTGASRENDAKTYKERRERSYGSNGNYETRYGVLRFKSTTSTLQWHSSGVSRLPHDQTNKYRWSGAKKLTTPPTILTQASKQLNHAIWSKQHHSSLSTTFKVPTATQMSQTRYVAKAIQKLYKPEQEATAKASHMRRSMDTNLDKNNRFLGLSENLRFSPAAYALKHFDSLQNDIYRKWKCMKFNRELDKPKSSQTFAWADSQHMSLCNHINKGENNSSFSDLVKIWDFHNADYFSQMSTLTRHNKCIQTHMYKTKTPCCRGVHPLLPHQGFILIGPTHHMTLSSNHGIKTEKWPFMKLL